MKKLIIIINKGLQALVNLLAHRVVVASDGDRQIVFQRAAGRNICQLSSQFTSKLVVAVEAIQNSQFQYCYHYPPTLEA